MISNWLPRSRPYRKKTTLKHLCITFWSYSVLTEDCWKREAASLSDSFACTWIRRRYIGHLPRLLKKKRWDMVLPVILYRPVTLFSGFGVRKCHCTEVECDPHYFIWAHRLSTKTQKPWDSSMLPPFPHNFFLTHGIARWAGIVHDTIPILVS